MNAIVQQILGEATDFILPKMKAQHDVVAEQAKKWLAAKDKLLPVLQAFQVLGAHVSLDSNCTILVNIAGDKECFVKCWKLWRSIGVRLKPAEKGATELAQVLPSYEVNTFFYFTSTVCKRVKIGTKMVEQDVYETQCGASLDLTDTEKLEQQVGELVPVNDAPLSTDDDIPF